MKRFMILLTLMLILCGCSEKESFRKPGKFYYPQAQITFGSEYGSITYEVRECEGLTQEAIIENYLTGPQGEETTQPFPSDISLTLLKIVDEQASLVLSDNYATLSGLQLTIANTCLAKTVTELCDVQKVTIQCESASLSGAPSITIEANELLFFDESTGSTETNEAQKKPTGE